MRIQMTRSDWEKAGPYENHCNCPGATMISRVMGDEMVSMSWSRYESRYGEESVSTKDDFNIETYREAERRYNAGEEVLFETTLIQ